MEKEHYNKVCIAYQNLSDRFYPYPKNYTDGYVVYNKEFSMFQGGKGEFFQQFKDVPFNVFFKQDYLDKQAAPRFYDTPIVKFGEHTISVHYDFYMVLFYSIADNLRKGIECLIEIVNSNDFEQKFRGFTKKDEYTVRYSLSYHDRIDSYLRANIPDFDLIYHLLHLTNSDLMLVDENSMVIRTERISNILKTGEEVYDFSKFKIA